MMKGTWKWNALLGGSGMALTFAVSLAANPLGTSLIRGVYCFAALFVASYAFRWVWGTFLQISTAPESTSGEKPEDAGSQIDLATPDDIVWEDPNGGAPPGDPAFSPLDPPKFATKDHLDPEMMAQAMRRLSED